MTQFLKTEDDYLINADTVAYISRTDEMEMLAHFKDKSAEPAKLARWPDDVEVAAMPLLAAAPGFMKLRVYRGATEVFRTPVVAWRISGVTAFRFHFATTTSELA